jgi:SpoVK/Ycf46/Vps4 family AAA+-type ATPase
MRVANVPAETLNVTQLKPVTFRKNAWERLVLDPEYKDIVQAMVSSYVDKTATMDDLIAGKGAGLVTLLHGPPGTGKTLTAGKYCTFPSQTSNTNSPPRMCRRLL